MNRIILAKGIEIVGILFAAFGGFLAGIAPPNAADSRFAVGLSSLLALIVLFTVSALSRKARRRTWVIVAGVFLLASLAAGFLYWSNSLAYTFEYPPGSTKAEYIAGTELTPVAQDYRQSHPGLSNSQLLAKFGGLQNIDRVWIAESVARARSVLIASYIALVLSVATAIFALTEGALPRMSKTRFGQ